MTQKQRIEAFVTLGTFLSSTSQELADVIHKASILNPWYTTANTKKQLAALAHNLTTKHLTSWLSPYPSLDSDKSVALILAGNIPLVGFHDIMAVLLAGFKTQIKVSSEDAGLTSFVLNKLIEIEPLFAQKISLPDRLQNFDLVIATGSDNSSRYFEYYFGKKPHIIRKNRNSLAILTGKESQAHLQALGNDIFDFFGLGCRSVSKIYIPKGYDIGSFYEGIASFKEVMDHFKYTNNYDYNKSIYLINADKHYDNGFLLLKEDQRFASPLAVVFYEEYEDLSDLYTSLQAQADKIQCIVTDEEAIIDIPCFKFGCSQAPALSDYADGVNTLDFLFSNV